MKYMITWQPTSHLFMSDVAEAHYTLMPLWNAHRWKLLLNLRSQPIVLCPSLGCLSVHSFCNILRWHLPTYSHHEVAQLNKSIREITKLVFVTLQPLCG